MFTTHDAFDIADPTVVVCRMHVVYELSAVACQKSLKAEWLEYPTGHRFNSCWGLRFVFLSCDMAGLKKTEI